MTKFNICTILVSLVESSTIYYLCFKEVRYKQNREYIL